MIARSSNFTQDQDLVLALLRLGYAPPRMVMSMIEFSMPERSVVEELDEITLDALEPGDVLFFAKDGGRLQRLFWAVNDIWLHTALVVERNGELWTAEVGTGDAVLSRRIEQVVGAYATTAVARRSPECARLAAAWAVAQVGEPMEYAWDDFLLAALVGFTRKGLPFDVAEDLTAAMAEPAAHAELIEAQSRTCSGFVHEAFMRAGSACELNVEVEATVGFGRRESAGPGDGPGVLPSPEAGSYLELPDRPAPERDQILASHTVFELLTADLTRQEMMGDSHISTDQALTVLKTVYGAVAAFRRRPPAAPEAVPGQWTSPTDLWRAGGHHYRARVRR
jgi:hypothetical protein